jgi:hypothetical protein
MAAMNDTAPGPEAPAPLEGNEGRGNAGTSAIRAGQPYVAFSTFQSATDCSLALRESVSSVNLFCEPSGNQLMSEAAQSVGEQENK